MAAGRASSAKPKTSSTIHPMTSLAASTARLSDSCAGRLPSRLHELQRVGGEGEFVGEHSPPDFGGSGEGWKGEAEGFDHQPAVIVDLVQGRERFVPVDASLAGGGAVIFADVN